ncbi:MAG: TMEM43 family protein, partial [Lysobacterales bacterium]
MARRRRSGAPSLLIALLVIAALAAAAWLLLQHRLHPPANVNAPAANAPSAAVPVNVSADRIDAANEGRQVSVSGTLRVAKPARDAQLGIEADAVALVREVEMLQWREQCVAAKCDYALAWTARHVDSHAFRDPEGHANSAPFPFSGERFLAEDVRLGAYRVDATLAAAGVAPVAYPVRAAQLPANLAATFREQDGVLYAGAN